MKDLIIIFQDAMNTPESTAEKMVAKYFLNNVGKRDIPILDVARECFTSQATVSRMVRLWGYESYNDFLVAFEKIEIDTSELYYDVANINDANHLYNQQWIDKDLDSVAQGLLDWKSSFPLSELTPLTKRILESNKIVLLGILIPGHYLQNLQYFLMHLGIECIYYSNPNHHLRAISELKENDSVIIASMEGNYLNKYSEVMIALKDSRAYRILITQNPVIKYNTYCDKTIQLGAPTTPRISKIRLAYFIDILISDVFVYHNRNQAKK